MNLQIEIYPDYVLIEGQRVNRPTGMSFSQWEAGWNGIKDYRLFDELERENSRLQSEIDANDNDNYTNELEEEIAKLKEQLDAIEGQYLKLKRDIEKALDDAK